MNTRLLALPAAAAAWLATACGGTGTEHPQTGVAASGAVTATATAAPSAPAAAPRSGSACAGVPASLEREPVGTALAKIPELSTLAKAAKRTGLVEKIDTVEDATLFAPVGKAFDKALDGKIKKLMKDQRAVGSLLGYHMVQGRTPRSGLRGKLTNLQGDTLVVKGSPERAKVNGARVICGELSTRNATVYLIDKVLLPK